MGYFGLACNNKEKTNNQFETDFETEKLSGY